MANKLRVLIVEDMEDDAMLLLRELKRSNYEPIYQRVQTGEDLATALSDRDWDIILSDYSMPQFSGIQALKLLQSSGRDLPFILVSGTVGENLAVEAMKAGASDYLLKDKLVRLGPAVERELREAEVRRARKQAETDLQKLNEELESKVEERTAQLTELNQQLREEITERSRVEEALQQSEEIFRFLAENSSDIISRVSLDGHFLYVSPASRTVLGYTPEELIGRSIFEIIHAEDRAVAERAFSAVLNRNSLPAFSVRVCDKQGQFFWLESTARRLVNPQTKEIQEVQMASRDITTRKKVEQELQIQAEQQADVALLGQHALENIELSSLMEEAVKLVAKNLVAEYSAIMKLSSDGESFSIISGVGWEEDFVGRATASVNYDDFTASTFGGEPFIIENLQGQNHFKVLNFLQSQQIASCLSVIIGAESTSAKPFGALGVYSKVPRQFNNSDIHFMQTVANVLATTIERRAAEEETLKSLEKEKELNELKSRFVSMVSHEFRTPLTSILSSAEFLKYYADRMPEAKKYEHLERIQISVKNMTLLLNDVLTYGKADAGKLEFKPAPLDLIHFCQSLVEEFQLNNGATHTIEFTPTNCAALAPILADESLLRQILSNLLTNAIKYSPHGGVVHFELICQAQEAIFVVQDQGEGIPAKDMSHLFEPFHRASNVGNIQGTGLGLAIVKKCVETHGGNISFDSEEKVGTTFRVAIPIITAQN